MRTSSYPCSSVHVQYRDKKVQGSGLKPYCTVMLREGFESTRVGGSMGLKRQTKRHQNNTPICFAHLDKCNGIVLACWRSTLPTYGAGKSPVFFSPSCEPASCRLLLPFLQLRRVPPPRQLALLVPYVRVQHKPPRVRVRGR